MICGKIKNGTNRSAWEVDFYETTSPSAQIAADKLTINCLEDTVQFVNHSAMSNNNATWSWDFPGGNPSTSNEENPKVVYSNEGMYNVTLTVTDDYGSDTQVLVDMINYTNNPIVMELFSIFDSLGFSIFRFNLRGVGKSEGKFDNGLGELADAAAGLDWIQRQNPNTNQCWVAGFSFGALLCMQLLMRRPEITRFISISPQPNLYDFNFLAPCPASGLIVQGKKDDLVPPEETTRLAEKLKSQKNITVDYEEITGANHFYDNETDKLEKTVRSYIERELNSKYR